MKIPIHFCYSVQKNCYATLWSYGEICVGCRCCDKDPKIRRKVRLKYWKWWLKEQLEFDHWVKDDSRLLSIQEKNVKANIRQAKKRVKYYQK
jgi:hypothetical protein